MRILNFIRSQMQIEIQIPVALHNPNLQTWKMHETIQQSNNP